MDTVSTYAFQTWPMPEPGQTMQSWQGGRCAACGVVPEYLLRRRLVLDHDHATGLTRGYLCQRCNLLEAGRHPRWVAWREGENPATMFGWAETYINMWGDSVIDTPADWEAMRDAIRRLPSA